MDWVRLYACLADEVTIGKLACSGIEGVVQICSRGRYRAGVQALTRVVVIRTIEQVRD